MGGRINDYDPGSFSGGGLEVITGCSSSSSCPASPSVDEGLASISTIESSSTRRRDRRGVTAELNGSLMSTAEVDIPEEVLEELEESDDEEREDGERRRGPKVERELNRWRAQGGDERPANDEVGKERGRGDVDVDVDVDVDFDVGPRTDVARPAWREKVPEERAGEEGLCTTPSTPISGATTTATEPCTWTRRRPSPRHGAPRNGQVRGQRQQHRGDRDAGDDDHHCLSDEMPATSVGGQGLSEDVMFSPPPVPVLASGAAAQRATPVESVRAPCHDGLVLRRGGICGDSSPVGETAAATSTTIVPESGSPRSVSSGRRRRRREEAEVDKDGDINAATSAARRAAAAEALNGLRMRGRIPPVRRGAGGGAATVAAAGRGGRSGRKGGRTSPSLLSVPSMPSMPSVPSVGSVASSSMGEQYGSSFEEDTEGSSSCSVVGGGGSGGWGSEPPAPVPAPAAAVPARKTRSKACDGGGGSGERNPDYAVTTPGSVGTEMTATPSSAGVASMTREGREYSVGGVGEGLDRGTAILASSGSAESGSSAAANTSGHSGGGGGGNEFAATALSFRRAAGCYSSATLDRVSTSSWALSAGVSNLRDSQEVVGGAYGSRGGSGRASASRILEEERQVAAAVGVHGQASPVQVAPTRSGSTASGGRPSETSAEDPQGRRAAGSPTADRRTGREASPPPLHTTPPPAPPPSRASAADRGATTGGYDEGRGGVSEGRTGGEGGVRVSGGGGRGACALRGEHAVDGGDYGGRPAKRGVRELLLHTSDAQVTPIVGSRSGDSTGSSSSSATQQQRQHRHGIYGASRCGGRVDQLPFEAFLPETVSAMHPPELEAHLTVAYNALSESSAPVRQKGQTLLYLQSLASIPRVANLLVNSTFLALLLR